MEIKRKLGCSIFVASISYLDVVRLEKKDHNLQIKLRIVISEGFWPEIDFLWSDYLQNIHKLSSMKSDRKFGCIDKP